MKSVGALSRKLVLELAATTRNHSESVLISGVLTTDFRQQVVITAFENLHAGILDTGAVMGQGT